MDENEKKMIQRKSGSLVISADVDVGDRKKEVESRPGNKWGRAKLN